MKRFALEQQVCRQWEEGLTPQLSTEAKQKEVVTPSFTYTCVGAPPTRYGGECGALSGHQPGGKVS